MDREQPAIMWATPFLAAALAVLGVLLVGCPDTLEGTESICADSLDNDGDGLVDCADPDCDDSGRCGPGDDDDTAMPDDDVGDDDVGDDDTATEGPYGTCGSGGVTGSRQQASVASGQYLVWASQPDPEHPVPLVVGLHGDEGHPDQALTYIWGPVWDSRQDFVLALPVCPAANGSWWDSNTASHADFIDDVLHDLAGSYNIDIDRAYAIGYSGGSCWLSWHGFEFQDIFAGIQWSCGGCSPSYHAPPQDDCKVDGRFHIASDDFLWDGAMATANSMENHGHEVEWVTASCSGHCCSNSPDDARDALDWFLARTKCDSTAGAGCGALDDLP